MHKELHHNMVQYQKGQVAGLQKQPGLFFSLPISFFQHIPHAFCQVSVLSCLHLLLLFPDLHLPSVQYILIADLLSYESGRMLLPDLCLLPFPFFAERLDSYAFYSTEVWSGSLSAFIVAIVTCIILFTLAWKNGRTWCNTICPVGTVLGFLSRFSLLKVRIDADKCKECSLCTRQCKASCIDWKNHSIDYSRCVACFDCLDACRHGAITYTWRHGSGTVRAAAEKKDKTMEATGASRRNFLSITALAATSAALSAQEKKVDGGLAVIEEKKIPRRQTKIVPAGSLSIKNFYQHCTACQLCVSVCPNQVLRPSAGLMTLMQPEMSYEKGYCRPECTRCSNVCPSGAISPVTEAEKSSISIGHAVWIRENCIPITDGQKCGNCARHCPAGAIRMVPLEPGNPDSLRIPAVNEERCIGCGACENLCPARPFSAIYVEGHLVHSEI